MLQTLHVHHPVVQAVQNVFGMAPGFAHLLAVYAEILAGDIVTRSWSIAGRQQSDDPDSAPLGLSNTHSKFETDASFSRPDAYTNDGDPTPLVLSRFITAYNTVTDNDRYTLHKLRGVFQSMVEDSAQNNPNFFLPAFTGAFFAPITYNMIGTLMSNHSASSPDGYLDGYLLKGWFAVTGGDPSQFESFSGAERIQDNWYRRPVNNPYTFADAIYDIRIGEAAFPTSFLIGGNINGVGTVQDVDMDKLTGGKYTRDDILGSNQNLACFVLGSMLKGLPTQLQGNPNDLKASRKLLRSSMAPMRQHFRCKPLSEHVYDTSAYDPFTGGKYVPDPQ